MKFIKKVLGKIKFIIYYNYSLLKIIILSLINKKRIYVMGSPIYGNLGDQAIIIAERYFLNENFKEYKVIEVESSMVTKKMNILKKLVGNSLIMVTGGGFIGSLWPKEDDMVNAIIENMNKNKIIILPQTIYFDNNEQGIKRMNMAKKLYSQHKNLYICVRERYSYDFMKKNFKDCNIYLVPDMVLYLKQRNPNNETLNRVILCLRSDKEKTFHYNDEIINILNNNGFNNIKRTDTVIQNRIYRYNRKKIVENKIEEFHKSKLIITDRLHGMIFAFLASTPCLVINSKSYKVKGVYNWIKEDKSIKLVEDIVDFEILLKEIFKPSLDFNPENFKKKYNTLIELIKECISNIY